MARKSMIRYTSSELLKAAHMAGAGYSAADIAEAIGRGVTAQSIYPLLGRNAIKLAPKTRAQISFPIVVNRALFETIEKAALRRGADPQAVAGRILEQVAFDWRSLQKHVALATREDASEAAPAPTAAAAE